MMAADSMIEFDEEVVKLVAAYHNGAELIMTKGITLELVFDYELAYVTAICKTNILRRGISLVGFADY
jgi:hypothetical protein